MLTGEGTAVYQAVITAYQGITEHTRYRTVVSGKYITQTNALCSTPAAAGHPQYSLGQDLWDAEGKYVTNQLFQELIISLSSPSPVTAVTKLAKCTQTWAAESCLCTNTTRKSHKCHTIIFISQIKCRWNKICLQIILWIICPLGSIESRLTPWTFWPQEQHLGRVTVKSELLLLQKPKIHSLIQK